MSTKKMSLANIQGKLTREEMRVIMAGSSWPPGCSAGCFGSCWTGVSNGICAWTGVYPTPCTCH